MLISHIANAWFRGTYTFTELLLSSVSSHNSQCCEVFSFAVSKCVWLYHLQSRQSDWRYSSRMIRGRPIPVWRMYSLVSYLLPPAMCVAPRPTGMHLWSRWILNQTSGQYLMIPLDPTTNQGQGSMIQVEEQQRNHVSRCFHVSHWR